MTSDVRVRHALEDIRKRLTSEEIDLNIGPATLLEALL
jgi:hypothetical protein